MSSISKSNAAAALAIAVAGRRLFPRTGPNALEPNETQVLLALFVDGEQTATLLAGRLELAKTTVSHALARLQADGFVTEVVDAADRRRRQQRLTARGRRVGERFEANVSERASVLKGPKPKVPVRNRRGEQWTLEVMADLWETGRVAMDSPERQGGA